MKNEVLKEPKFVEQIVEIIRSGYGRDELLERLSDYHENDIAQSLEYLTKDERAALYNTLGMEWVSGIIPYIENPEEYIDELGVDKLAAVINELDSDDAVDLLENIDESVKDKICPILDEDIKADIKLINSYNDDEIGSLITTNYICISKDLNIRQAMHELVKQAGDNDNISTIYVVDNNGKYCGAIDLKDLIIAREHDDLDSLISYSYPYLADHEGISESIEKIKDYANKLITRPMYEERRWGSYRVLDNAEYEDGTRSLTKTIHLNAGKHISYQLHRHRSETWTCVEGEGIFVLNGERKEIKRGDVMNIPLGHHHAIKAITDLTFIEVQIGNPLVEEDIERFDFEW